MYKGKTKSRLKTAINRRLCYQRIRAATLLVQEINQLVNSSILFSLEQCLSREKANNMWIFCKEYTNRWGKRMIAAEYGYTAWRFWVPARRKKK